MRVTKIGEFAYTLIYKLFHRLNRGLDILGSSRSEKYNKTRDDFIHMIFSIVAQDFSLTLIKFKDDLEVNLNNDFQLAPKSNFLSFFFF